jgi:hypothetical protein
VGEKVWAYNPKTHHMELEPVLHVWINHDNDLVDLALTTTPKAPQHGKAATKTSETLHTNKKHPFLTEEQSFLPVGQIKLGMHILEANGLYGVVTGWKVVPGVQVMYNLEVAQDHTYTVGTGQWVVHNCTTGGESIPWSSKSVRNAALALDSGDTEVTVANRSEAEELFLEKYQGNGYSNTTGLTATEVKDLFGSKAGTYHWDDNLDSEGGLLDHGADNPHGSLPHLQIHPFEDEEIQDIIRIFYWP